jgi:hypothetical protein
MTIHRRKHSNNSASGATKTQNGSRAQAKQESGMWRKQNNKTIAGATKSRKRFRRKQSHNTAAEANK